MKKRCRLFIAMACVITTIHSACAQKADSVWFDKTWKVTTSPADYFYLRTILKQNDTLYRVTDYYPNHRVQMTGSFSSLKPEKRSGQFNYYRQDGTIHQKMTWTNNMVTEVYQYDNRGRETLHKSEADYLNAPMAGQPKTDDVTVNPDQGIGYVDGADAITNFLKGNIKYPREAQLQKITGTVYISVVIDESGNATDYRVIKGVDSQLDIEALRVVKLLPGKWIPARERGRAVRRPFTVPVIFSLN